MEFSEPQPLPRLQPQEGAPERGPTTLQQTDPQTWIDVPGTLAAPQGPPVLASLPFWLLPGRTPNLPALWSSFQAMPMDLSPAQAQEEKKSVLAQTAATPSHQAAASKRPMSTLARHSRLSATTYAQLTYCPPSLSARPLPSRTHWTCAPPMRPLSSLPPHSLSPHPLPPLPELILPMRHGARAPNTSTEASPRPILPQPPSPSPHTIPPLLITTPAPKNIPAPHRARHHPQPTHAPKPFPLSRPRCVMWRRRWTGTAC
jgi:hypothetical protein